MQKPVYFGLFLPGESREKLLKKVPQKHSNLYAEHVTYWFKPPDDAIPELKKLVGTKAVFAVIGAVSDQIAQAVLVAPPADTCWAMKNKIPHCTISCAPGGKPAHSNKMLEEAGEPDKFNFVLEGVFDFFPRTF